jgi:PAS domain S-box-containing protein
MREANDPEHGGMSLLKAFRYNPIAMIVIDRNGCIAHANRAFCTLVGYEFDDLVNVRADRLPGLEHCDQLVASERAGDGSAGERVWRRLRLRNRAGEDVDVRAAGESIEDARGAWTHSMLMFEDIRERLRLERERQVQEERLRQLTRRMMALQEEERRRVAQELHDEWGQVLTSIKIDLQLLQTVPAEARPRIEAKIDRLLRHKREMITQLRPSLLDEQGLIASVRRLAEDFARHWPVEVHANGMSARLPHELEIACFRLVQEALTNASRHADAGFVEVFFNASHTWLNIDIVDDGVGFDIERAGAEAARYGSAGLTGMDERVRAFGGRLKIFSRAGAGTRISARIPVADLWQEPPVSAGNRQIDPA